MTPLVTERGRYTGFVSTYLRHIMDLNNKTALITGAAEGLGFAMAQSLAQRGMNLVLTDIDESLLSAAAEKLSTSGTKLISVPLDVTKPEQWQQAVAVATEAFGKVHMLINNAGVSGPPGPIESTNHDDWRWVIDVNLMGVVYGAEACVPAIKSHGEGGWIINVASMAGMMGVPFANAYTATKTAVVAMTESWRVELAKDNIAVSALCPSFVQTRIHLSHRNRQEEYARASKPGGGAKSAGTSNEPSAASFVENGIDPTLVGERVVEALEANETYIFTHPTNQFITRKRAELIDAAFERAKKSDIVGDVTDESVIAFSSGL